MIATRRQGSAPPHGADRGSAALEFIVLGVGLLVPVVYLATAAATVQAAAFASAQAAREAARAFSSSATPVQGHRLAESAARLAFVDHGLELPRGAMRIACTDGPCLSPGSAVEVVLAWEVALPWLPGALAQDVPARIPIEARQRVPIDDYRGDVAS